MIKPDENILDYIDDYVHGLLSSEDAEIVRQYCETSRLGRVALEEAERRYEALQMLPPSEASEKLIQQTVGNIELKERKRGKVRTYFSRTVLLATAASILIIGSLNLYYYRMAPSPYDLRLLGQKELLSDSNASLRVAVLDHNTGQPVAGVPVRVALYNPSTSQEFQLASFTTDDRGAATPRFALPDWEDGSYQLRVTADAGSRGERLVQPIELCRQWRLMVSTDKPVYQPGQKIHMRSLGLKKPDLKPVAGHEVTFSITDPKGNVIFKQKDVTSGFGIASADCQLAAEIIEGDYRIQCDVGETTSDTTVKVEKYVLPKFKVAVTVERPFYAPGEQVTGSIQADYFFGKPVAGGDVQIDIRGSDAGQYSIESIDDKTDDNGNVKFQFRLPDHFVGREQEDGNARFMLVATVTDTAGQKYSTGTSRVVTANPIGLEVIPESGTLVQGMANTIYVFTSYADGRPARTRLTVSGSQKEIETSSLGVASFEITPQSESVGVTVKATDAEGQTGRKHVNLTCGSYDGDFLIRADRAVYTGGETMKLVALGGGVEPVFVDFLKDGQTILTQQVEMQDGRGQYDFDLPPDLFGTIEICAYRFRGQGLAVRKSRIVYVRQARQLRIAATMDQDEYRPGAKAKIKLTLTDPDGKPVPGAISLKAVDEAVFAVLSQRSGMEQTFFLLEQEMLEPVYAIYPGWSPELFSELPIGQRIEFEQALFSRTAAQVQGREALPDAFFIGGTVVAGWSGAGSCPFTLATTSFPEKVRQVTKERLAKLAAIVVAWISLGVTLTLVAIGAFAVFHPKAFLITGGVCLGGCCLLSLPLSVLYFAAQSEMDVAQNAAFDAMETAEMAAPAAMDGAWDDGAGAEEPAAEMPMTGPMDEALMDMSEVSSQSSTVAVAPRPRVREWFPETLLWRPELITDDRGQVTLEEHLADSITTWRLSTTAISGGGQLGSADFPIKVFQPFFVDLDLPVSLTRNDQVSVPVVVYNYLDKPQTVQLTLKDAAWFQRLEDENAADDADAVEDGDEDDLAESRSQASTEMVLTLDLGPNEIRSLTVPIKVLKVGKHQLEVTALASGIADAVRREIEVVADGRMVERVVSGTLSRPLNMSLSVPDDGIDGSVRAIVKLYPSTFSQLVEGLDAIFRMPSGCFEQTSSTTYPNILALDYLRRTGKSVPDVEAKARQYIHTGYQRLVSFEVDGGGFDWFGNPPANRTLTAYGLMEFEDMANVHDVDPQLIDRTRDWLLARRQPNGSWANEQGMLNDGLASTVNRGGDLDLAATAYIAWAVFADGRAAGQAVPTLDYLLAHPPESIDDPYLLAVTVSAIAAIDAGHGQLGSYLARLDALKQTSEDGKLVWWDQSTGGRTTFYGSGQSGSIETTAMAALALLNAGQYSDSATGALGWLIEQKDPNGTWHSTQATVLSLKALLAGTGATLSEDQERRIEVVWNGEKVREIVIPSDQSEVMKQFPLTDMMELGNEYRLELIDRTNTSVGYQVTFRYNVPDPEQAEEADSDPLSIDIQYDRERLTVDETVTAVATVTNNMAQAAPMVILDLPIPGGFVIDRGELDELVGSQQIAKYQVTARKAIVYLRRLDPADSLQLRYRLRATMPVKVAVPEAEAYEYYDPATRGSGGASRLEAVEA